MNYFDHCTDLNDLNDLKAEYRRLALKHHPDLGGDTVTMQAINATIAPTSEVIR